ncbi:hypothetical protein [Flavobacterium sp. LAR06]|uniref:hypothetical protein n=1 Tax=Flavobacterium sp. LAR06 TaxID=3064897 RepID=UPI0035C18350
MPSNVFDKKIWDMYKKKDFYCLPHWQEQVSENMNAKIINENITQVPAEFGTGYAFYSEVIPGISVLLMDFELTSPMIIERFKEDTQRYIFHYDISDNYNVITFNNMDNNIGYSINLGFIILDNQPSSFFKPSIGRTFALRIFIDRKLMNEFINNMIDKKKLRISFTNLRKKCYFDKIDASSILLLLSIKEKSIFEDSFKACIKGTTLQLLGVFLNRFSKEAGLIKSSRKQYESERLLKVREYLIENLYNQFPSIDVLSKMAGMSQTKFKFLFKKQFQNTPKKIFIKEKMVLANKMLISGDYKSLTEILDELNYNKLDVFKANYFEVFKRKPGEDLAKKRV